MLFLAGADAEAISRARPKINWSSDLPVNLADRRKILTDLPEATREAFQSEPLVFFIRNSLSRQSNPDPLATPIVPGATFEDRLSFVASTDVQDAVLRIHQPAYGLDQDECHVVVTAVTDRDGNRVGEVIQA